MAVWVMALGLGVGACKALLVHDSTLPSCSPSRRILSLKLASFPFLGAAIIFLAFWPDGLTRAGVVGSFLTLCGVTVLLFSLLVSSRSRLLAQHLVREKDNWLLPGDLLPLGARWGWLEEVMVALVIAPPVAATARAGVLADGLLLVLVGWLGLVLPRMIMTWVMGWLGRRAASLGDDAPSCCLPLRLHRALLGSVCFCLALIGTWVFCLGIQRFIP